MGRRIKSVLHKRVKEELFPLEINVFKLVRVMPTFALPTCDHEHSISCSSLNHFQFSVDMMFHLTSKT